MRKTLSAYKFKKLAWESLYNGIRLHEDSLLLFSNGSFPTSLQLSILAMEEIAKAKWIDHVYYSSITNNGLTDPSDDEQVKQEQKWLSMLYYHPRKQFAFIGQEIFKYSPKFVDYIEKKGLEELKQKATYVGLSKKGNKIDVNSRINIPLNIKVEEVIKIVSLVNDELIEMCNLNNRQGGYFGIYELDVLIDNDLSERLKQFVFKSKLKSKDHYKHHKAWDKRIKK
ncbi:MAG: AbiV family abortive infection protein [Fulvivirga sp.]